MAITGVAAISPIGNTCHDLWANLLKGRNGVRRLTRFDGSDIGVVLAAEVSDFDVTPYFRSKKLAKDITLATKYLVAACHEALCEAGYLEPSTRDALRCGLIVGAGSFLADEHIARSEEHPLWYLDTYANLAAGTVSINFDFHGYYNTIVNACASGTKAICDAALLIEHGVCDMVLVGATDSKLTREHLSGFHRLGVLSQSSDPDDAIRPFDRDRDGTVIGEGAGALVLESIDHARARNANILAIVAGVGFSMDAYRKTEPDDDGRGLLASMREALRTAQINADQLGYINAHGTSTRANDRAESRAIQALLGNACTAVPVSSTKSMTGHMTAASGAVEATVCVQTLRHQVIHATRNSKNFSDVCPLDYVLGDARESKVKYVLSNSAGIGGFNASVVMRSP